MQRSQTESPLPKRPSGSEGGLAATIEAASSTKTPPSGKGLAMVVLAVLVMAAVVYEIATSDAKIPARTPDGEPLAVDARFDLPGDLSVARGGELALALSGAAHADAKQREASLSKLLAAFDEVPTELREPTRARLLAHLATISNDNKAARKVILQAATKLIETLPAKEAAATRRLNLVAELSLDDDKIAPVALVYLSNLPVQVSPADAIAAVILDANRALPIRTAAAHALPREARTDAIRKLAADESTPRVLRQALQ